MKVASSIHRILGFLRNLFWFLLPWLALFAAAVVLIPLYTQMPGTSYEDPLPPATVKERDLAARIRQHVEELADHIGERNMLQYAALQAAANYVENQLRAAELAVTSMRYEVDGISVRNLIAEIPGNEKPDEIIVVGAHYDSATGTPGANDNASGVAAMLEIARSIKIGRPPGRTLRFVAFVNEEPPYFQTWLMGSRIYARTARQQGETVIAMLSLETIGYFSDRPVSQFFPYHLGLFYPWTGNFIAFVANLDSRELLYQAITAFRRDTAFPSEGLAAPAWVTGVDWSDHWSFWEEEYPAVMITDTALYRYPHYHDRDDTTDKIDFESLARVTGGLAKVVESLASVKHSKNQTTSNSASTEGL